MSLPELSNSHPQPRPAATRRGDAMQKVPDPIVALVQQAMHELHAPSTAEPRRRELQAVLHRERERAASTPELRAVWRGVIGGGGSSTQDELLLWFALSCISSSLADAGGPSIAADERLHLKASLQALLLGPAAASVPVSSRSKGELLLAQLARVAWPAEEPTLLHEMLALLRHPGPTRSLGARLLSAVVDEFGARPGERPSVQAKRQDALLAFLPDAHAALTEALHSEAASAGTPGATPCLDASRALLSFGRVRDGAATGARAFTEAELRSAPLMLQAVAVHLVPRAPARDAQAAIAALGVVSELCELKDMQCAALLAPLVPPLVACVQQLASAPMPPFGLDEDALDDLENALCYACEPLYGWLLGPHLAMPAAVQPLLAALWTHSLRASPTQLRRCVVLSEAVLDRALAQEALDRALAQEALESAHVGGLHRGPSQLAEALLPCARALVEWLLLSRSAPAADAFAEEALDTADAAAATAAEEADGGTHALALSARAVRALAGGSSGGDGDADGAEGGPSVEGGFHKRREGEEAEEGLEGFVSDVRLLLCRMASFHGAAVLSFLSEGLTTLLAQLPGALSTARPTDSHPSMFHVALDVGTLAGLLAAVLPAATAASADPLSSLPIAAVCQMLLQTFEGPAPDTARSPEACHAELSLLYPLSELCAVLGAALGEPVGSTGAALAVRAPSELEAIEQALARGVTALLGRTTALLSRGAGGGVVCRPAASLLLEIASRRWPVAVHRAGGLHRLASLGGGNVGAHAVAANIPQSCWPTLFAAVTSALLMPPRGLSASEYLGSFLGAPQQAALREMIESIVAPLRAPPLPPVPVSPPPSAVLMAAVSAMGGVGVIPLPSLPERGGHPALPPAVADAINGQINNALGPPLACICAIVTSMRDAPREVRAALDGAMAASELHLVLQRLLGTLHGLRPPPLVALAATLWLVHALTAAVSGGWGGADAAHWALQGALHSLGLVLGGGGGGGSSRAAKAQSEAVLEASLELVHAAARLRAAPAASARTVGTILDACGPEQLGALLAPSASVPEDMRLSPPRREQLMRVAFALLSSQWKALSADEVRLNSVMGLVAAGLSQPSDLPAARQALQAIVQLHERWASGGAVGVVKAALGVGSGVGGGPTAAQLEQALQLRGLILQARLEPSLETLHEDATDALHAALTAEARRTVPDGTDALGAQVSASFWQLTARCLSAERWLAQEHAQRLLAEHAQAEVGDRPSFQRTLTRLASAVAFLRMEAAHAERGWGL